MWKPRRARKRPKRNELVLGEQQAAARRAEAVHRARHDGGRSPLEDARYDSQPELSLLSLSDARADDEISEVASRYRDASPAGRSAISASLTMDDFYSITTFARRSAARALASSKLHYLEDALTAVAMIASDRIDSRDISWVAAYVRLAGVSLVDIGIVDEIFESAAELAEPVTAEILRSHIGSGYDDVCAGWLMTVLERGGHKVLLETGGRRFEPSFDILALALKLQQILNADGYLTRDPVVGSGLGFHWLDDSAGSAAVLERAVGSVQVGVVGRPDSPPMEQLFLAYVYELASEDDAVEFKAAWRNGKRDFASLAVCVGRLLVLFISRSSVAGVPTVESQERLGRFDADVRTALTSAEMHG